MPPHRSAAFLPALGDREYDLCGVGTALVDYLSYADYDVVRSLGIEPGTMTLIDGLTASKIRAAVGDGDVVSGGTVANTTAAVASLGGRSIFVGAVATDDLGRRYESDLEAAGVRPLLEQLPVAADGVTGTGTCYVIVAPDRHRTMATTLGVSGLLGHETITESVVASSSLVYFDAYLLDFPDSQSIVKRILDVARRSSTRVALGLADPFAVERHLDRLRSLVEEVDLVFSNEQEVLALSDAPSAEAAMEMLRSEGRAIVITRSADGALLGNGAGVVKVDAVPVAQIADTTGAGDFFAAGVCFGVTRGLDAEGCGALGAICAAEVIAHLGARPASPLQQLAQGAGLL